MVVCLERGADLHIAQLMPLPLTVSCFSKIHIGFTFLVPAHPGSPGQRAVKWVCCSQSICNSGAFGALYTIRQGRRRRHRRRGVDTTLTSLLLRRQRYSRLHRRHYLISSIKIHVFA